ncbi:MAG: LysR family transcriptional regulator [Sulfitobacter sp.]
MDWNKISFDWNRARAFLVTADEGSFSAAARALGLAQPTLGRQVTALEEELGVALFERVGRGLVPTPAGLEMLEHVRRMGEAAYGLTRIASGQSHSVEGTVSITASEVTSAYVLPPILADLRRAHPGIRVDVVASNTLRDLHRREADIALRHVAPEDPDLIARKLRPGVARLYAAQSYLDRAGPFETPEQLALADFVGFEENETFLDGLNAYGVPVTSDRFIACSASHLVQWQMMQQGIGVGVMAQQVGDATPGMVRLSEWLEPFRYDAWLVAHRELNTSRRLRIVFDFIVKALLKAASLKPESRDSHRV